MDLIDIPPKEDAHQSQGPGDWVKDLFAPIYDFNAIVKAGRDGYIENKSKIRKVPILDPQSVREVFERVHERVIESERLKLLEIEKAKRKYCLYHIDIL